VDPQLDVEQIHADSSDQTVRCSDHPDLSLLSGRIADRSARIGVVGLGYVGLPLACTLAEAGFYVTGVDRNRSLVASVCAGENPMRGDEPELAELLSTVIASGRLTATTCFNDIQDVDVVTINVDTPVGPDNKPAYESLNAAVQSIGQHMRTGCLVIVESTVAPGTTANLVRRQLEVVSGRQEGDGFFLGVSPERIMPGKALKNLREISRVCGGSCRHVASTMTELYQSIGTGDLDTTDLTTAETVKVVENTYRDVQIAFANEIALLCLELGLDVWEIRELVNKVPFREMHEPGGGVGGHCIPKDPWLLMSSLPKNINLRVIPAARETNDNMPSEVARVTLERVHEAGMVDGRNPIVAVLGYSYRPDTGDTRNSPSNQLVTALKSLGMTTKVHDPYVAGIDGSVQECLHGVDAVIVMVEHSAYRNLQLDAPVIVKARNLAEPTKNSMKS
jgi:UDP-N-acetyl-D-mannosaminuronic acid dehydrogenase